MASGTGVLFAVLTALLFTHQKGTPTVEDVQLAASADHAGGSLVTLPYAREGAADERLFFSIRLHYNVGDHTHFWITPDDCVEALSINGTDVLLPQDYKRCSYYRGFPMDFAPYLREGSNSVRLVIVNGGGPTGLKFEPTRLSTTALPYTLAAWLLLTVTVTRLGKRFGRDAVTRAAFLTIWFFYLLQFYSSLPEEYGVFRF